MKQMLVADAIDHKSVIIAEGIQHAERQIEEYTLAASGKSEEESKVARGGDGMTDWSKCAAVESVPGRLSGAWVFTRTRVPVSALFGNLAAGATVKDFLEWFPGVEEWQVKAVLEHEVKNLDARVSIEDPV